MYKHGHSTRSARTAEYRAWIRMNNKCSNPKNDRYPYYGGRGIKVCPKWRDSFEVFLADMGPRPSSTHSIERVNNNEGYSPDNCKWGTKREQILNRRVTRKVIFGGVSVVLANLPRHSTVSYKLAWHRIMNQKWEVSVALNTPANLYHRRSA